MNFSAWILSIVGIVLLTLMVDIVLPEGQTNKYIKSVFAIVTVFVIASPIPSLLNGDINMDDIFGGDNSTVVDETFLQEMFDERMDVLMKELDKAFLEEGMKGVKIFVEQKKEGYNIKIDKIKVNIANVVIVGQNKNINIKEKVLELIVKLVDIPKEKVVFI